MIYHLPLAEDVLDQGDIIDGCPLLYVASFDLNQLDSPQIEIPVGRVLVLTQTCDLANQKTPLVVTALVYDAQTIIDQRLVKASRPHQHRHSVAIGPQRQELLGLVGGYHERAA
jgi:hypothetical protein